MTIEAIARRAQVSAQTVFAVFKSKTGILTALLDETAFSSEYEDAVQRALSATDPPLLPGRFTTRKTQLSIYCAERAWLRPSWQSSSGNERACGTRDRKE